MEDSVQVAYVIPSAADAAFQIYSLKRSAYAAVLRAFCAQSDILSRDKVRCLTELRNELKILQTEHAECLVKARSNKQIKSFSVSLHSKGNTCSTEVIKDFLGLACVLPDAGDTVFQIHCLERSAYASVLRAFCAVTNHLSLVKLLSQLKNELRISHSEHKEVLMKVSLNEHIKSLRKFSLANLSVVTKTNPAFDVHAVLHDKIGSTDQVCTSSTSCLSLIQQSSVSENSMSSTRDIGISDSSNGAEEGPYFESHTVVCAKRLKTVNGHAPAYLKCGPSNQLPVAVSAVMVNGCTADTLDCETLCCEVKSGCASSPIFQEKHSQLNAGQSPLSVDHASQESGKRKTVVPEMSVSESLGVMDRKYEIEYQKPKNKDSDLEHGSEIIKLCLTASLLSKVERIFKENPDSANLEKAKLTLKAQEKDLLDALAKLSEVSYDVVYFGANHNHRSVNLNEHGDGKGDEAVLPKLVSSSDETLPEARLGDGGTENKVKIQGIASVALSPSAATPTGGTASSSPLLLAPPLLMAASSAPGQLMAVGPTSTPSALCKKTKFTAEQKERMLEFTERFGWHIHKAGAEAVDAFCAQIGVPQRVFKKWLSNNRYLASTASALCKKQKFTAEQKERMLEFAERFGWRIHKAGAEAVDAFCAQIGVPQHVFKNWMYRNRHLASAPSALCKKTKLTAEQKERMLEFVERFGWCIHKAGTEAVDAFCAQIGVPQHVFKNWMYRNRHLASVPSVLCKKTKLTAEQKERMLEFVERFGWCIHKAGMEAVDAFCAQIGVPQRVFKKWLSNNRYLAKIPPSALTSHHQGHPAATAQGPMTEEDNSLEAEVAVSADGGKEDENEVSEVVVIQGGMGHRARKPNNWYRRPEWITI